MKVTYGISMAFPERSKYNLSSRRPRNSPYLMLWIPLFLAESPDKSTDFSCSKTETWVLPASATGLHTSQILQLARIFLHGSHLTSICTWPKPMRVFIFTYCYLIIPFLFRHCEYYCVTSNCFWQLIICWRCIAVAFTPIFNSHLQNLRTKQEFKNCQWRMLNKLLRSTEILQSKVTP